jgi:hypothetical protein
MIDDMVRVVPARALACCAVRLPGRTTDGTRGTPPRPPSLSAPPAVRCCSHPHCPRNWRCDDKSTQLLHPSCAVRRLCDRKTCERFLSCQWPPPSSLFLPPLPPPAPYRRLRLLRPRITTCLMPCLTFVNDLQHPKVLERAPGADDAAAAAAAAAGAAAGATRVDCVSVNAVWPHVMSVLC